MPARTMADYNIAREANIEMRLFARGIPKMPASQKKLCVVCEDGPADYALLMCGHRCLCVDCVKHFEPGGGRDCPLCRQPIERTMRIHDC